MIKYEPKLLCFLKRLESHTSIWYERCKWVNKFEAFESFIGIYSKWNKNVRTKLSYPFAPRNLHLSIRLKAFQYVNMGFILNRFFKGKIFTRNNLLF